MIPHEIIFKWSIGLYDLQMSTSLDAPLLCTHACLPHSRRCQKSRTVTTAWMHLLTKRPGSLRASLTQPTDLCLKYRGDCQIWSLNVASFRQSVPVYLAWWKKACTSLSAECRTGWTVTPSQAPQKTATLPATESCWVTWDNKRRMSA